MNRTLDKVQVLGKEVVALPFQFTVAADGSPTVVYPSASVLTVSSSVLTGVYNVVTADTVPAMIAAVVSPVVVGGLSTVTAGGTTPPTVTVSGMPKLFTYDFLIDIQTGGARGTATFRWSVDAGATWEESGVLTAATVVLGDTNVTVAFAVGTYNADNTYAFTANRKWDGKVDVSSMSTSGVVLQVRQSSDGTSVALPAGAMVTGVLWQRNSTVTV